MVLLFYIIISKNQQFDSKAISCCFNDSFSAFVHKTVKTDSVSENQLANCSEIRHKICLGIWKTAMREIDVAARSDVTSCITID